MGTLKYTCPDTGALLKTVLQKVCLVYIQINFYVFDGFVILFDENIYPMLVSVFRVLITICT